MSTRNVCLDQIVYHNCFNLKCQTLAQIRSHVMEAQNQLQLREVLEYVLGKGVELDQLGPVATDLMAVQKQIVSCHSNDNLL